MKVKKYEQILLIVGSLILNKFLLFWLISAEGMLSTLGFFGLVILNFMILAKSVDKMISHYEELKKEQRCSRMEMPISQ